MKTHQITSHDMTWHLATNHITSPHVTSEPTALLHRSLQPTTSKQVTTSPPWNGWRLVHSNNSVWASQWLVTVCTFYRQILSLTYSFFFFETSAPGLPGSTCIYIYTPHRNFEATKATSNYLRTQENLKQVVHQQDREILVGGAELRMMYFRTNCERKRLLGTVPPVLSYCRKALMRKSAASGAWHKAPAGKLLLQSTPIACCNAWLLIYVNCKLKITTLSLAFEYCLQSLQLTSFVLDMGSLRIIIRYYWYILMVHCCDHCLRFHIWVCREHLLRPRFSAEWRTPWERWIPAPKPKRDTLYLLYNGFGMVAFTHLPCIVFGWIWFWWHLIFKMQPQKEHVAWTIVISKNLS